MTGVFLDTSGLIATWDVRDHWHSAASSVYDAISDLSVRKLTTTFVLLECANAASRRSFRRNVDDLREELSDSGSLIFPTDEDWQASWDEYRAGQIGGPGIVDLISFRVMKALGITDAFTNDSHFRTAGLTTLF